ncbi:MAG: two-component sensor histidine kinase BarA, partial [Planctomycetaceae bacterium]|nr:two-component sensor histidine kinase BarA [Planctomycetaceae bacterium]
GVTNLLMETHLDGEQLDYVNTIQQSGDTLLTVINDILDFSKIEAGKVRLESLDMDLRELVDDSIELFSARAREKQLELLTHFAPDCPARLKGDPVRLRQVLFNLLGNALKFTEKGFVRVELDGRELGDGVTELQVSVIDSGIGISPEAARRLFNPFSQADGSTTRKYGGTGLGLSICRKLVEL